MSASLIPNSDLTLTSPAQHKLSELVGQIEDPIEGVRVYATSGGCSGINFGMSFTDQLSDNDNILECEGFKVIVDSGTLQYLRGVEIDFVDRGDQGASFVFNNLQPMGGGGCSSGGCGGGGGGCA